MTIQIKRGNTADRPNPLLNGELGWDADTRRLWIGNGVVNENLFVAGAAVTTDFSIYVCTIALGGGAGDADGLAKSSGTATATSANKLVDSAASFDSSYVNKTVYNITDDTWAKITAVDSATQLSLSANIMAVGESYETTNAFATVPLGFAAVPGPYSANVTLRISPGTFSDDVTFIGKIAAGSKTLTVAGSTTGTTTIDGAVEISQKITVNDITFSNTTVNANYGAEVTWSDCPLANTRLNTRNGSDLTWDNCDGSGTTKLYTYLGSKNLIENTTITVGNNPENITSINSTITKGCTIYVATTALGGDDAVADGLAVTNGTATGTTANKLVDSGASFGSDLVGKTVWNSTDDTWAKVNAVDSATQLSLSANIMASGEGYVIANAYSTIQGAVSAVSGTINCNTTIKISNGTFSEDVTVQGKSFSGAYELRFIGTLTLSTTATSATVAAGSGATQGTVTKTSAFGSYDNKLVYFVTDDDWRLIDYDTTNVLTLVGSAPSSTTQNVKVYDWATTIEGSTFGDMFKLAPSQVSVVVEKLKFSRTTMNASINMYSNSYLTTEECCIVAGVSCQNPGTLVTYNTLIDGDGVYSTSLGVFLQQATYLGYRTKVYNCPYGIRLLASAFAQVREGFIIDTSSVYGAWMDRCSSGRFDSNVSVVYNTVRNCGTGLYAAFGGMGKFTATVQYSGNTTDKSADATSYGYID